MKVICVCQLDIGPQTTNNDKTSYVPETERGRNCVWAYLPIPQELDKREELSPSPSRNLWHESPRP